MAPRRRPKQREAQLAFEALSIEGGLLSPSWLARVAQLQAGQQSEADYRVPKGLHLRDEIGRYWRVAQAHWSEAAAGLAGGGDPGELAERFVPALLRQVFGFGSLAQVPPVELGGRSWPLGHVALGGKVPVVVAPLGSGLETQSPHFGEGGRRRSPFGLVQEFLNASNEATWGVVSDGHTLRLARDNASLTRPAWLEVDLARLFNEERYADFAALWLILHETRFGTADHDSSGCALERWREAGREEGTRAREHLRTGVEEALIALGSGFLALPENTALRSALERGTLTKEAYFNELLRLVYRLIFILTAEERGLLHPEGSGDTARALYTEGYSLRRLRERATRRSAHDRNGDLWDAQRIVFRGLRKGEPRLGLPALAGLFAEDQCPNLDASRLENRALLMAVFKLGWLREDTGLARVNWRDMGPEELGSVYESLLELVPQVSQGGRAFGFATGGETKGNARKTTGSYYTPDSLVQVLLDSALEPVVQRTIAAHPQDSVEALLRLSIVDPACGSGHFLLSAARRLAAHVARLETQGTPSAVEYRRALRRVVGRCIHGVDLNPMAIELCKVALWMEAVEPGLPLTFLDSHLRVGNALLGTTPALMAQGIPNEAWSPLEGDDRRVASALKKRNKKESESAQAGMETLWAKESAADLESLWREMEALERAPDSDLEALAQKEAKWADLQASRAFKHQWFVADAWCAAFVWPKEEGEAANAAPTQGLWRQLQDGRGQTPEETARRVEALAGQYHFFHWHLAFPRVFAQGGFDVVLGNPPWERLKLQEQEFFASRSEGIAKAVNAAARKKLIAQLPRTDSQLWNDWCAASRQAEGQSHLIRSSGRYPLCGKGDVNTYALFAEHNRAIVGPQGRAGFIVPTGIATDDTTKEYFGTLIREAQLARFYSFENEEFVFPSVHHAFRFALLTLDGAGGSASADLVFFARSVAALNEPERHFTLSAEDFEVLNPNTRTCPTFRSRRDADLNLQMYRRAGVLWREGTGDGNPWGLKFLAMLHMANDSGSFRSASELRKAGSVMSGNRFEGPSGRHLPLMEAKMVHLFDHRFGTYEGQTERQANQGKLPEFDDAQHGDPGALTLPNYWVHEAEVDSRLSDRWSRGWLLGWRDICRSTDQRTVVASLIPRVAVNDKFLLKLPSQPPYLIAALYGNICSFVLDYAARQKVGGTSLKYFTMRQLPVLAPSAYAAAQPWTGELPLVDWLLPRVLELTYTAWDLEPFARDVGYQGPPFRWDPARRALLRAELDAAFFHLYGLSREDTEYVLDTFPIVRKNDEKAHGEYRTQRLILEAYDAMTEAGRSGQLVASKLIPPPADPTVAHPATTRRTA
jgi:hypothetical protein